MPYKTFSVLHIYVGLKRVGSSFFPLHQSYSSREAHITIQTKGKMYFFPIHCTQKTGNVAIRMTVQDAEQSSLCYSTQNTQSMI